MPDHPYVYASPAPPPVQPGATRLRVFRRRPRPEDENQEAPGERDPTSEEANDAAWKDLLEEAVEDLNAAFSRAAVPFECVLEEEEDSISLHVRRVGEGGERQEVEEEVLEPGDLPRWLARFRTRLGLLVDETA